MFKTQMLITGAKPSSGTFKNDDGEKVAYDNITFYVKMPLIGGKGFATTEYKLRNRSADFDKIFGSADFNSDVLAEVSYIESTNGKGRTIREITDIVLLPKKGVANVQ